MSFIFVHEFISVHIIEFPILVLYNRRYLYFSVEVSRFIISYFRKLTIKCISFRNSCLLKFSVVLESIQFNLSFLVDIAILSRLFRLFKSLLNMKNNLERIHEMRL